MVSIYEVLGTHELKTLRFLKAVVAEFLGTCMLVVVGCGAASTVPADGSQDSFGVASCFGLAVATAVWVFGHTSGAHINPSISIGFLVTGHISIIKCLCYIAAQVSGAIAGACLLWVILPPGVQGGLGSTTLVNGAADWQGVIVEMLATFMLVMTVFASCDRLRTDHGGSIALAIGFCVAANLTWMVYWTGPICGGILAALIYDKVFAEKTEETEKEVNNVKYNNCQAKTTGFLDYVIEIDPPAESKSENKPQTYNIGNGNSGGTVNLQENVSKDQILMKSIMALDSKEKYSPTIEEIRINYEREDEQKEDNVREDTSNL